MRFQVWLAEIRAPFLLLSAVLVCVGSSLAAYHGFFNPAHFALATVGLILIHISVNTLNEYFDYKTGVDLRTVKTPFSGGSGVLPAGLLQPSAVLKTALASFAGAAVVGGYFLFTVGLVLLPILLLGAVLTLFYTQFFARIMLGEIAAGLGMGPLPVLGAYLVHTGFYTAEVFLLSVPPGILVFNLLFLNEFPDVEADRAGGKRNLVMALGYRRAAILYSALTFSVYVYTVLCVLYGWFPMFLLLSLLTLPFALKAASTAFKGPEKIEAFIPGLKANVMVVLATQGLFAAGYLIAALTG